MTPASTGLPGLTIDDEFYRLVDELTRRGFLAGSAGTAALPGLAACASGHPGGSAGPATRTIETPAGASLVVPASPRRVIALANALGLLLELGIMPVGTWAYAQDAVPSEYYAAVNALPKVQTADQTNVEAVAALHPDLIFTWSTDKALAQLQHIAPTYAYDGTSTACTWQGNAQQTAYAVNRLGGLDKLADAYNRKLAAIKKSYAAQLAGKRWYVVSGADGPSEFSVEGPGNSPAVDALDALGASFGGPGGASWLAPGTRPPC